MKRRRPRKETNHASDLDTWKAAWSPVDVRTGAEARAVSITNPVVEAAMVSLTHRVNLSTGILHPSDRGAAINMFRLLRQSGEQFKPSEIRAWARQHEWRSRHADDLADLAQKIRDGTTVRGEPGGWADNIVELWRQDAAKVVKLPGPIRAEEMRIDLMRAPSRRIPRLLKGCRG